MRGLFPLLTTIRTYSTTLLKPDVIAAITVWAIVVPESMAYAGIAGMPPETGLYVATVPLLVYALLASSQRITVGPSAAVAALSASTIAPFAASGSEEFVALSILLAMVTGVLLIIAGIARLGVIAEFLSEPVLKGFMVGVALTIVLGQSAKLFGIEVEGEGFFAELIDLVRNLGDVHLPTLAVGASSLAALFLLHGFLPKVPAALVVVVGAILAVSLLDLESAGVHVAGDIAAGLPKPAIPSVGWGSVTAIIPGAIGLAIVVYGESMALSKTFGARHGERVDADQELLALGTANTVGAVFGGFAAVGSNSRTAAANASGQRTQVSSLVVVALLVVTILFLTSLFHDLPEAALAAIVIHAVWRLLHPRPVLRLRELNRFDYRAAVATLFGVLVFDVLAGLLIGVVISLIALMMRAVRPRVTWLGRDPATGRFRALERDGVRPVPSTGIIRFENELFFANASVLRNQVFDRLEADPTLTAIVIDAEAITAIDTTAATEFGKLIEELASKGVRMVVARMESDVRDALIASGIDLDDRIYPRVTDAADAVSTEPS